MPRARTQRPFREELPVLISDRGLSLRAAARLFGLKSAGYLSKVLTGAEGKRASPELRERVRTALALPADYFPEDREEMIMSALRSNPSLRECLYEELIESADRRD